MQGIERRKILYIEDSPESRFLVQRVLSRDFDIIDASDALTGIEKAIQEQPALILLDINMPDISGHEAARRLRTLVPGAVLVAFSADITPETRDLALAAGCSGFLTKPFDIDTFRSEIKAFLENQSEPPLPEG